MIKGTVKGQGSPTYYPYPYPQVPLPITLKGYPYPCYCLDLSGPLLSPFPANLAGEGGRLTLISADQNSALADQNMWGRVKTSLLPSYHCSSSLWLLLQTTTMVAIINVPHCCVELAGACLVAVAHGMVLQHCFCCSWCCPCVPWWLCADESCLLKVVAAGGGGEVRLALLMLAWSWEMVPL